MIAVTSRNAAVTPPCRAGISGLPDQFVPIGQNGGQFITASVEGDPKILDVGHACHQRPQRAIAALLDGLHRLGARTLHDPVLSTVKAPVAPATGRAASSSVAVTRTKATDRVM